MVKKNGIKNQEFYVQYKNKSKINSDVNLRERYNCMLEVHLTRYKRNSIIDVKKKVYQFYFYISRLMEKEILPSA